MYFTPKPYPGYSALRRGGGGLCPQTTLPSLISCLFFICDLLIMLTTYYFHTQLDELWLYSAGTLDIIYYITASVIYSILAFKEIDIVRSY